MLTLAAVELAAGNARPKDPGPTQLLSTKVGVSHQIGHGNNGNNTKL